MKVAKRLSKWINPVPAALLLTGFVGVYLSGLSVTFVVNELIIRFIRDGVLVLSLVIPVVAGMGLNFAMVVGAICAQVGIIVAVDYQWQGIAGLFAITAIGSALSIVSGFVIGLCLNRVKGKEMITTIIIGFLATSLYQLVFMAGYGTVIRPRNQAMILSRGIGVRNMIDLDKFRNVVDSIWVFQIGGIEFPLFMVLVVLGFALVTLYLLHTRLGQLFGRSAKVRPMRPCSASMWTVCAFLPSFCRPCSHASDRSSIHKISAC